MFVGYIGLDIAAVLWYASISPLAELGLLALVFAIIVLTGMKHAWVYVKDAGSYRSDAKAIEYIHGPYAGSKIRTKWLSENESWVYHNLEIHNTQWIGEYVVFALAMLSGASPLRVLGVQFLARLLFQGYINWGSGKPFIDMNEQGEWGHGEKVTKFLPGRWSLLKPVIGVACIGASFLVRYIF